MMILMMGAIPSTTSFNGDGTTQVFTISASYEVKEIEKVLINGFELLPGMYTYLGNNQISFTTPPQANDVIEVYYI